VEVQYTVAESGRQAEARKSSYQYMIDADNDYPWQPCSVDAPVTARDFTCNPDVMVLESTLPREHAVVQEHWFPSSNANRGAWMRPAAVHQVC
jgi:hypothetical protein